MTRVRRFGLRLLDTVAYAVVTTAVIFAIGATLATIAGRDALLGAKWFMFFVGFLLFGYSAFQLRPTPLWKDEESEDRPAGLQVAVSNTLPDDYQLAVDERHSTATKLFVASVFVLTTSFLMETVFGVAIGA